jgi:hypothetical protein
MEDGLLAEVVEAVLKFKSNGEESKYGKPHGGSTFFMSNHFKLLEI